MKLSKKLAVLLLALGLLAAACGDGDDDTTTQAPDTTAAPAGMMTDVGVTDDEIVLGLLSDLSGPFAGLVGLIVSGQQAFWEKVNADGGIDGRQVRLEIVDTAYDVQTHVQLYGELKDQVVAFAHSTGSPQTIAINNALKEDEIVAIPLTWYSGWTDGEIGTNLPHHAISYCAEAHNVLGYIYDEWTANNGSAPQTLAVAGEPGDYGGDSVAGAILAAEALGLEVVYNGDQQVARGQDNPAIIEGIVGSDADIVWITTNADDFTKIFSGALEGGFRQDAVWSGAGPSFSPAMLGSDVAQQLAAAVTFGFYNAGWGADVPGFAEMEAALLAANPELPVTDFLSEGWVEASIMKAILDAAAASGDMTQAGVLRAAQSLSGVDLQGLSPSPSYSGSANDNLVRQNYILKLDLAGFAAQGGPLNIGAAAEAESPTSGFAFVENLYTHPITEALDFTGACWTSE